MCNRYAHIFTASSLKIDKSMLTGEAEPCKISPEPAQPSVSMLQVRAGVGHVLAHRPSFIVCGCADKSRLAVPRYIWLQGSRLCTGSDVKPQHGLFIEFCALVLPSTCRPTISF